MKRRSLATGMIASGPGAGTFVMSPILALSIEGLGWRGAFIVMAGLVAIVCVLGCTFDPNTPKNTSVQDVRGSRHSHDKEKKLLRNAEYLLMVFVTTIVVLGNSVPQVHMVSQTVRYNDGSQLQNPRADFYDRPDTRSGGSRGCPLPEGTTLSPLRVIILRPEGPKGFRARTLEINLDQPQH